MDAPLNASALQAGALISKSRFAIPQFQREYSWQDGEVSEFWSDLSSNVEAGDYFLGLVILTEENGAKNVVDGQQRLVTLTLLATALFFEAKKLGRKALADRIEADFLRSIDYDTDFCLIPMTTRPSKRYWILAHVQMLICLKIPFLTEWLSPLST